MWVYTLIATTIGVLGFLLGLWNLWRSNQEPFRALQFERRKNYAKMLEGYEDQIFTLYEKAKRGIPVTPLEVQNLEASVKMFQDVSRKLTVPPPEHSLHLALRALNLISTIERRMIPTDDSALTTPVHPEVLAAFERLHGDLESTLQRLWKIEQGKTLRIESLFKKDLKALKKGNNLSTP